MVKRRWYCFKGLPLEMATVSKQKPVYWDEADMAKLEARRFKAILESLKRDEC